MKGGYMYLDNFKLFLYKYQKYFMYGFLLLFICLCFIIIYVSFNSDAKIVEPEVIALNNKEEEEKIEAENVIETIFIDINGDSKLVTQDGIKNNYFK